MARPAALNSTFYKQVWTGDLGVQGAAQHGGRLKDKTFFAFLEVGDQCKHDNSLRGYCTRNGVAARRTQDTQVDPANDGSFDYYEDKGEIACRRVARYMTERWTANQANNRVFDPNGYQALTLQGETQSDGWSYEMTMYYRGGEIYVAFHCYPG